MTEKLKKSSAKLIREYQEKVTALKNDLIGKINDLPDNPKIKRIGGEGKAFTVNFEDLGDNWSPFYHDYKAQYQELIDVINKKPVEQVIKIFDEVIKTGYMKKAPGMKFNPVVRKYLKEMM